MSDETPPAASFDRSVRRERVALAILLLAAAWLFAWGIGSYPLWDPWEPKYAHTVREMQARGDYLTPFLDGNIRWTKPILVYWAIGASMFVFGDNPLAVRLPSVLAALFGLWVVFYSMRRLRGPTAAFVATAVLATLPQYFYMARQAMPDMLLVAFVTGSMGFLALARFDAERRERHLIAFWACLALGFLAKGPLAIVLALWAVILFLLPEARLEWLTAPVRTFRELRQLAGRYRLGRGLLVFALIAGPWYVAMLVVHGYAFVDNFIVGENIKRFSEPQFGHDGITSRYVTTLVHGTFPWVGLLLAGLVFLFQRSGGSGGRLDDDARLRWYFLSWFVGGFSIFTTAGTKLDHYLLPIMPAAAILVALAWEAWFRDAPPWWVRPALLLSVLLVFLPFRDFVFEGDRHIFSVFAPAQDVDVMDRGIELTLWALFVGWIVATALAWLRPGTRWVATAMLALAFAQGVYFCHIVIPAHADERNLKLYAERYAEIAEPDAELVFFGFIRYSIHYYHGPDYVLFEPDELQDMLEHVRGRSNVYIIAQEMFFDAMLEELHRTTRQRWTTVSSDHPLFVLITNSDQKQLHSTRP